MIIIHERHQNFHTKEIQKEIKIEKIKITFVNQYKLLVVFEDEYIRIEQFALHLNYVSPYEYVMFLIHVVLNNNRMVMV
jgi:hypothetical protein